MTRLWKGLALFAAIACAVWTVVLWRWQATARVMSAEDIVVWLGLLPIVLFALALLAGWAWRGFSAREADRAAAPAAGGQGATGTAGAAGVGADEAARHSVVQLLGAHLVTAAGGSARELVSAAKEGAPRPGLDAELKDDDGMPLLAARIADLDPLGLEAESAAPLAAVRGERPEWAEAQPDDTFWRALAALREPLLASVATLEPWAALLAPPGAADRGRPAAPAANVAGRPGAPPVERYVRVLLGWPAPWREFEQALGRTVATAWLAELGAAVLPDVRFVVNAQAVGGEELLLQADRLLQTLARAGQSDPIVVAACHSTIGAEAVATMEQAGELHRPGRPKGRIPAEAAAALVLAGAEWPKADEGADPLPHLHRPALAVRDKSVDAGGRVSAQTAAEALVAALRASRLDAGAIARLAGDADQHSERAAEFFAAAADQLPQLDAAEDVCAIGHATGAIGGVGALVVVAVAAEVARTAEAPCAALAVGDPTARLALIVRPGPPPASGENANASAPPPAPPA